MYFIWSYAKKYRNILNRLRTFFCGDLIYWETNQREFYSEHMNRHSPCMLLTQVTMTQVFNWNHADSTAKTTQSSREWYFERSPNKVLVTIPQGWLLIHWERFIFWKDFNNQNLWNCWPREQCNDRNLAIDNTMIRSGDSTDWPENIQTYWILRIPHLQNLHAKERFTYVLFYLRYAKVN